MQAIPPAPHPRAWGDAGHLAVSPPAPAQVEDDETPEMIMAKFAALERIQSGRETSSSAEAAEVMAAVEEGSRHGILTDTQLLEVFKQVCGAMQGLRGAVIYCFGAAECPS